MDLKPLLALLKPRTLSASYAQTQSPTQFRLSNEFYRNPTNIDDDNYELIYFPSMRKPAPGNNVGAEARIVTTGTATDRKAKLFSAYNKVILPTAALNALLEPDSPALQDMGRTSVARIMDEFATMHKMFREVIIAQIMTIGRVNMNDDGNILQPTVHATTGAITNASGTTISADFEVANSHRGNLGGIITDLWTNEDAEINTQLVALKDAAEAAGVEEPTEIWLHTVRRTDFMKNAQVIDWAQHNNRATDEVLAGSEIKGLFGFNWHFYGGKYENPASLGTYIDIIPKTSAIICPASTGAWLRPSQGLKLVPKSLDIVPDAQAALRNLIKMYGQYAYAKLKDDPAAIYMYMGDTFGLNYADPNAIWMPTISAA